MIYNNWLPFLFGRPLPLDVRARNVQSGIPSQMTSRHQILFALAGWLAASRASSPTKINNRFYGIFLAKYSFASITQMRSNAPMKRHVLPKGSNFNA